MDLPQTGMAPSPMTDPTYTPGMLDRSSINDDDPLRLDVAARLAFPDGSMSGSILRAEAGRGRLVISRIGGRYYTTLRAVRDMVKACQDGGGDHDSGCGRQGETPPDASPMPQPGSLSTEASSKALAALNTTLRELSASSKATSRASTQKTKRRSGNVVPIKSPSQMS